jgi:Tfp pilus assembly protein PilZ
MADSTIYNRRQQRHQRVNVQLPVRISTIDAEIDRETGKPYFRTSEETCANVSRGGAFVATPEPVAPGRRVLLEIDLPSGDSIQTIARVAWSRVQLAEGGTDEKVGIGVEFLGGSPEHLAALERYVSRTARASRRPLQDVPRPQPVP